MSMQISYGSGGGGSIRNTYTTGDQSFPDVLGLSNDGSALAYNSADQAIRVDFFNAGGVNSGAARYPADNGNTPVAVGAPSLTQLANGNVLVLWDDNTPNSPGIRGHLYTPTGNPVGSELTFDTGDLNYRDPQVTALKNGNFVISYNYLDTVVYSLYTADATFKKGESVNAATGMFDTAVAALADGGFVVTYTDTAAASVNVRAVVYNADGSVRNGNVVVDNSTSDQDQAKVVGLPDGNFAVVYADSSWSDESGTSGITLRIFTPDGTGGSFIHVNTPTPDFSELTPDVAVLPNGLIDVVWSSLKDDSIIERLYNSDGTPTGSQSVIMDDERFGGIGSRSDPTISSRGDDSFTYAWKDSEHEANGSGSSIWWYDQTYSRQIFGDAAGDTWLGDQLGDFFAGGGGNNTFVIRPNGGADWWSDFAAGVGTADKINLTGFGNIHNLAGVLARTTDSPDGAKIDFGGDNNLILQQVHKASLAADDFIFAPLNDFNGDGKSDVLFNIPGTNFNSDYLWQMNDRAIGGQGALDLYDKAFNVQVVGDFDGDGKSDVLFRNPTTGGVWEWLINDKTIKSQGAVDVADPSFALLGSADFNGDGKSDLLFRNSAGFVYMWEMDGKVNTPLPVGPLSPVWHIAGAGDFDLDGKADLLLHNVSNTADNGAYFLWKMDDNHIIGQGGIERPAASWHTLAVGDFDGDGKSDFAIRNVSATPDNGAVWVYLMDGTTIKSQGAAGIVKASEFNTVGVGDYNADGKDDILFRSNAGYFYSWDMNGTHLLTEGAFGTQAGNHADPSFAVVTQHWDLM